MNDERIQSIVLEAISQVEQTSNPAKYAEFNFNVYEIAYKAVKSFLKNKYNLWKEYLLNGNDSMKIKISGLSEIYEELFGEEIE